MSNFQRILDEDDLRDKELWELAKLRAGFKRHFTTYLLVISFLWIVWFLTGGRTYNAWLPWPVWPMLGWGIGITSHYLGAYVFPKSNSVEREYENLKKQKQQKL